MRKLAAKTGMGLVLVLLLGTLTFGQGDEQKRKKPKVGAGPKEAGEALIMGRLGRYSEKDGKLSLEETIAQALQQNPDIRVAEAKIREAEAELHRTRLQVMQKTITLYHVLESERASVLQAEEKLAWHKRMVAKGYQSIEEVKAAETALSQSKSKLAGLEAEMPSLLGKLPQTFTGQSKLSTSISLTRELAQAVHLDPISVAAFSPDGKLLATQSKDGQVKVYDATTGKELSSYLGLKYLGLAASSAPQPARGAMADKIRQALDKPVTINLRDKSFDDILKAIQLQVPGIPFHMGPYLHIEEKANFTFEQIPLGAVLQAFEDTFSGGVRLVVRDYGILVTTANFLPDGAVLLQDFWKGRTGAEKTKSSAAGASSNQARIDIDYKGQVKAVDANTGLVTISIGSDAGVSKGQVLEVYRLNPKAVYLGKVEIIEARLTESVGKPVTRTQAALQAGDQVAGSLVGR